MKSLKHKYLKYELYYSRNVVERMYLKKISHQDGANTLFDKNSMKFEKCVSI